MYGVGAQRGLYEEGVVAVKVETLNFGQCAIAITEIKTYAVGLFALTLDEEAVGKRLGEGAQHQLVGHKALIFHLFNVFDVQRVGPQRVLSHGRGDVGADGVGREGYLLAFLREAVVAIGICQRHHTIGAGCHTTNDEVSTTVGTCHTQQRRGKKRAIVKLRGAIQTHQYTLYRFQVFGQHHVALYLQGVDVVAR